MYLKRADGEIHYRNIGRAMRTECVQKRIGLVMQLPDCNQEQAAAAIANVEPHHDKHKRAQGPRGNHQATTIRTKRVTENNQ